MAEPKKRATSTRSGNRRSHLALKAKNLTTCPQCKKPSLPHLVCAGCGFYNGTDVLKIEEKQKAKAERRKLDEKKENE